MSDNNTPAIKKAVYKKWWFWLLVIIGIIIIANAGGKPSSNKSSSSNSATQKTAAKTAGLNEIVKSKDNTWKITAVIDRGSVLKGSQSRYPSF